MIFWQGPYRFPHTFPSGSANLVLFVCLFQQVQKLQNIISSRASQYNHDMKRKEREFNKLKERLNQLLADKKERKQGKMDNICSNN